MFGICIESSHAKGMGHLFRQLRFARFLTQHDESFVFMVNDDGVSVRTLAEQKFPYERVDLKNAGTDWQGKMIDRYKMTCWIDDRLETDLDHSQRVSSRGIPLVVFDNRGEGATLADLHFAGLTFETTSPLPGKQVFRGTDYLILDADIDRYKRERTKLNRVIVTMGGSDTYNVTDKIVKFLKSNVRQATIILGPSYQNSVSLKEMAGKGFEIKSNVDSLIAEFRNFDLVICGGGVTAFEAGASGLPSVVVANELFEIPNGQYLEKIGCSSFAGHHVQLDGRKLAGLDQLDLSAMSHAGLSHLDTQGSERVFQKIMSCLKLR